MELEKQSLFTAAPPSPAAGDASSEWTVWIDPQKILPLPAHCCSHHFGGVYLYNMRIYIRQIVFRSVMELVYIFVFFEAYHVFGCFNRQFISAWHRFINIIS